MLPLHRICLSNIVPNQIPVRCQTHLTLASHPKHANHDDQNDPNVAKTKMKIMDDNRASIFVSEPKLVGIAFSVRYSTFNNCLGASANEKHYHRNITGGYCQPAAIWQEMYVHGSSLKRGIWARNLQDRRAIIVWWQQRMVTIMMKASGRHTLRLIMVLDWTMG